MIKKSKLKAVIIPLIIALGVYFVWYFFIKSHDYAISFYVKTTPGTVYERVLDWKKWDQFSAQESTVVVSKTPFSAIHQHVPLNNTNLDLFWTFQAENDSLTKVRVEIKDNINSFKNRLLIPFMKTEFTRVMRFKFIDFKNDTDIYLDRAFRAKIVGLKENPEAFVVYVPLKSSIKDKALNMMRNDGLLLRYIDSMKLGKNGNPIIEVTDWHLAKDSIEYNYAFPILKTDSLPQSDLFKFKKIPARKSIKAIFNGNYRISQQSWYAIYEYALRNNLKIDNKVFETFFNNPHNGGNDLEWKTEVFIPVIE